MAVREIDNITRLVRQSKLVLDPKALSIHLRVEVMLPTPIKSKSKDYQGHPQINENWNVQDLYSDEHNYKDDDRFKLDDEIIFRRLVVFATKGKKIGRWGNGYSRTLFNYIWDTETKKLDPMNEVNHLVKYGWDEAKIDAFMTTPVTRLQALKNVRAVRRELNTLLQSGALNGLLRRSPYLRSFTGEAEMMPDLIALTSQLRKSMTEAKDATESIKRLLKPLYDVVDYKSLIGNAETIENTIENNDWAVENFERHIVDYKKKGGR